MTCAASTKIICLIKIFRVVIKMIRKFIATFTIMLD